MRYAERTWSLLPGPTERTGGIVGGVGGTSRSFRVDAHTGDSRQVENGRVAWLSSLAPNAAMRSRIRPPPARIARILSLGRRTLAEPFRSLRRPDEPGKKSEYSDGSSSWSGLSCSSWGGPQIIRVAWRSGGGLGSWASAACGSAGLELGGTTADQRPGRGLATRTPMTPETGTETEPAGVQQPRGFFGDSRLSEQRW